MAKLPQFDREGCLVYGAIVADKVPGTILFSPAADRQDISFKKADMTHFIHELSFGDHTHALQNEFAHITQSYCGCSAVTALVLTHSQ